jgi:Glutathione S-transferase, N-terminal domain
MTNSHDYTPPKVWAWNKENGGRFANINRPVSGSTHDKDLPVGRHPLQLYSLGTPNGVKVTVMLEELLALGHNGAEYDAWLIKIGDGDQFGSGFAAVNPNSKIPALLDRSGPKPIRVFESGAILMYLAEKFGAFLPGETAARAECLSWLFWQMGSAPYLGGGFGHFYAYAPAKIEYATTRSPISRSFPGMAGWRRAGSTGRLNSSKCRATRMSSVGPMRSWTGRPLSADAWSIASKENPPASCTSVMSPATSKRRRRISLRSQIRAPHRVPPEARSEG